MTREEAIQVLQTALTAPFIYGEYANAISMAIEALQAEPIVIRSRTHMPTKDFKEWAKRIREENPNVIVIPCDAEVVSAEDEDRLYIKIYADDEPSVKAEKLYQICGETQNREVTEWLKEYFSSAEDRVDSSKREIAE